MPTKKQWLGFPDAIGLAEEMILGLRPKVSIEQFIEQCLEEHRPQLTGIDLDSVLPEALLCAACASGQVRARSFYAPGKHEPVPPEFWHELELKWWWMQGVTEDDQINVPDLRQWFASRFLRPRRRGRKPKVDWDGRVKREVFALLDHHGLPDASDPEWSTQADIEAAVAKIVDVTVSESTIREHTVRFITEYLRAKKKAGN
jgi:hypothetical protein